MTANPESPMLPPELAELQGLAAGADAALAGADLVPGAKPAPEVDPAAELGDLLTLGIKLAGQVLPPVPKFFPPEVCQNIAAEYLACAEKYGWTWHTKTGGPEVRLAVAVGVPAFLCAIETRKWLAWQREQAAAPVAIETGKATADPLQPLPG